ncbi:MAG: tetratricopeptide repeat protein [Spirochaetota bacterium]
MNEQEKKPAMTNERMRAVLIEVLTKYRVAIGLGALAAVTAIIIIIGYSFVQQGRMVKANEVYERGFSLFLQSRRAGNVLEMNQMLNDAVTSLQDAEKKASGTPLSLRAKYFLGNSFYYMKNQTEAVKQLTAVSTHRSFYLAPQAMYDLILISIEGSNYDDALNYGSKFMKAWPKSYLAGEVVMTMSMVERKLNRREKAITLLKDFLKANPDSVYKKRMAERVSLLEARVI